MDLHIQTLCYTEGTWKPTSQDYQDTALLPILLIKFSWKLKWIPQEHHEVSPRKHHLYILRNHFVSLSCFHKGGSDGREHGRDKVSTPPLCLPLSEHGSILGIAPFCCNCFCLDNKAYDQITPPLRNNYFKLFWDRSNYRIIRTLSSQCLTTLELLLLLLKRTDLNVQTFWRYGQIDIITIEKPARRQKCSFVL